MPERDGKDQGEDSPKQAGSCRFARHSGLATNVARTCILRVDFVLSFSSVTFVLFCFVFVFFAFTEAAALRSIVLRSSICMHPDSHTQLPNNCLRHFSFLFLSFCVFFFF